jgi:hypothetical protein
VRLDAEHHALMDMLQIIQSLRWIVGEGDELKQVAVQQLQPCLW